MRHPNCHAVSKMLLAHTWYLPVQGYTREIKYSLLSRTTGKTPNIEFKRLHVLLI